MRECIVFITLMKSCVGRILAGKSSRHAFGLCNVQVFARVCMCVCVWERKTSGNNEKKNLYEYEKMWSLFYISTHISNIHIYIFCTTNITLVCNLSGPIKASRFCHKYIIHSAIWSLCTRVSLLYMSHERVTPYMYEPNKIINLLNYFSARNNPDCHKSVPTVYFKQMRKNNERIATYVLLARCLAQTLNAH